MKDPFTRIGRYPHHGINLPLASLHTKKSCGIGEFLDLIPLIDWMKMIPMDTLQLLPLNDSGFDPSPYNALSAYALNPIYLSLWALPDLDARFKRALKHFAHLLESRHVAYHEVLTKKLDFLHAYYMAQYNQVAQDPDYLRFVDSNTWVLQYNTFKQLLDSNDFEPISKWKQSQIDSTPFYTFLQYLCFKQLSSVKAYAEEHGIYIKGDIPILISPESVEVWANPHLFDTTLSVGAPPDIFTEEGQNWGFPLYNWKNIFEDNFGWWERRLKLAGHFYDIYRIDHIIGFFRIWAMEKGQKAIDGRFIPIEEWEYLNQGRTILEAMLGCSDMLPIGEDLGIIPDSVRAVLKELEICRTIVPRWERDWDGDKHFLLVEGYPEYSLTTLSTHDSATLAQWWEEYPDERALFNKTFGFSNQLNQKTRFEFLEFAHNTPSYFHINLIGEYLALFDELVWPDLDDERINRPGEVLAKNWTYRIRPSIEEMSAHHGLTDLMGRLTKN